jgi:hypothetical protein
MPAVAGYVNVFGGERFACVDHSRTVRRLALRDRSVVCFRVGCEQYALGVLERDDGRYVWPTCLEHRDEVRTANPDMDWVHAEQPGSLRVLDLTTPVGAPPGAYGPDVPRCWVCGRRQGWEHDTAETAPDLAERHVFAPGPGVVGPLTPEVRAVCRGEFLDGLQTGRVRRGEPLLTGAELDATFTPFDPVPEPGRPTPRELADIRRRYPDLPAEHWEAYALRARAATERRREREGTRG